MTFREQETIDQQHTLNMCIIAYRLRTRSRSAQGFEIGNRIAGIEYECMHEMVKVIGDILVKRGIFREFEYWNENYGFTERDYDEGENFFNEGELIGAKSEIMEVENNLGKAIRYFRSLCGKEEKSELSLD